MFLANTFIDPRPFLANAPSSNNVAAQAAEEVVASNLAPILTTHPTDAGQVAMQTVMRSLVGPVQTADEYKARLMTLLESRPIDRMPISDDHVVLIDDDADPSRNARHDTRALRIGLAGSRWRARMLRTTSAELPTGRHSRRICPWRGRNSDRNCLSSLP